MLRGYEATGQHGKAINTFKEASCIIPHLFYPRYRLVPLHYDLGQREKTISMARSIVQMEVKVPSKKVGRLKAETAEFLKIVGY